MKLAFLISAVLLTGCAKPPQWLAEMHDRNDPCQDRPELNRPAGYKIPNWCGASSNRTVMYNMKNQPIGYIKQ